jgi:hypothetical protein
MKDVAASPVPPPEQLAVLWMPCAVAGGDGRGVGKRIAQERHVPVNVRAAPLHLLRTLLRFEPCVPCHQLRIAPALPRELGEVRIDRLPFAGARVSIRATENSVEVNGLPPDIELVQAPVSELTSGEAR